MCASCFRGKVPVIFKNRSFHLFLALQAQTTQEKCKFYPFMKQLSHFLPKIEILNFSFSEFRKLPLFSIFSNAISPQFYEKFKLKYWLTEKFRTSPAFYKFFKFFNFNIARFSPKISLFQTYFSSRETLWELKFLPPASQSTIIITERKKEAVSFVIQRQTLIVWEILEWACKTVQFDSESSKWKSIL